MVVMISCWIRVVKLLELLDIVIGYGCWMRSRDVMEDVVIVLERVEMLVILVVVVDGLWWEK